MVHIKVEYVFDFEKTLKELELILSGRVIDEEHAFDRVASERARYLNDEGVLRVMTIVRSHVNMNTCMSDLSQEYINQKCANIFTNLYVLLHTNRDAYGIRATTEIKIICDIVDSAVYASLMRGKDGQEAIKYYRSMQQRYVISNSGGNEGVSV